MGSSITDPERRLQIADRAIDLHDRSTSDSWGRVAPIGPDDLDWIIHGGPERDRSTPAAPVGAHEWATQLAAFSAILDRVTDTDGPRHLARIRVGKAAEEFGEVEAALIAWEGSNPRKPDGPLDQVLKELLDVATAALGAYEHLTDNRGASGPALDAHCRFLLTRMQNATG